MRITFVSNSERAAQAKRCLKHKLYVPKWLLATDLQRIVDGIDDFYLVIAEVKGKPVACATLNKYTKFLNVFVLKSKRRQGIGRALVSTLELASGISRYLMDGSMGEAWTKDFYDKVGVFMPYDVDITLNDAISGEILKYRIMFKDQHLSRTTL